MTKVFKAVRSLTKAVALPNASEQLMAWLKEKPQTYGWGAILAYDRQKANKMLKQEHISRFNSESILLPVSLEVIGGGETKKLYGYEFDSPIISFENYSNGDISNEPRCVLRMPIIAGSYMTVAAKGIVTSISVLDPLDGQVLSMIMDLKTGTVNDKQQVMFNIQDGTDFSVDVNDNYLDQVDVGKVFKAYFEDQVPDDKKVWALSQIDTSKNEYLKPLNIQLEVRKYEDAAEIADGELIICVGMEGDVAGSTLPIDFEYLTASNSATLILGQSTLLEKVVGNNFEVPLSELGGEIELAEKQYKLRFTKGFIPLAAVTAEVDTGTAQGTVHLPDLQLTYGPPNDMHVGVESGKVMARWRAENYVYIRVQYTSFDCTPRALYGVGAERSSTYSVNPDGSGVVSAGYIEDSDFFYITVLDDPIAGSYVHHFLEVSDYKANAYSIISREFSGVAKPVPEINSFVLESILFKNEDTVSLSSCALPNDLVMFGDIGPTASAFEVSPMEAVVLHGKTQQFTLAPQGASAVTWSVESASGDPEFVGSIHPTSGLYTAPDIRGYKGTQARVRVIATYGNYRTYALVSVLKKTITVNPLVTVKVIGEVPSDKDKVTLSTNSSDGNAPTWKLKKTGLEGTLESTTGFSNVYTPRPYNQVDVAYVVDEIIVTDSAGIEQTAVIVVDHGTSVNSAMTEGSSTATTVQLQCKVGKEDVTAFTAFNVLLGGSGTINETGLYTQAQEIVSPFALVNCVTSDFGREVISYILVPLPLSVSG
ncbi:hypothetical protein [Pseudomonas psychrophila]|uniref:hypothetical protein n=1 Tax=Pseudomonas psychrophila TaxID=122355 RepID=UPI0002D2FA39|nr:hypothetical protein [Pseudomonas psychrophila]